MEHRANGRRSRQTWGQVHIVVNKRRMQRRKPALEVTWTMGTVARHKSALTSLSRSRVAARMWQQWLGPIINTVP